MTQQNAALVEQSAAAAESLKQQASRLHEVVHRFQLGTSTVEVAGGSRPRAATFAPAGRAQPSPAARPTTPPPATRIRPKTTAVASVPTPATHKPADRREPTFDADAVRMPTGKTVSATSTATGPSRAGDGDWQTF
jgi:methyl-accepting chemotaxis protein